MKSNRHIRRVRAFHITQREAAAAQRWLDHDFVVGDEALMEGVLRKVLENLTKECGSKPQPTEPEKMP